MIPMSLLALGLAQAAPSTLSDLPPNRWTVDYGTLSCTLARRAGNASSPIVALNLPLGRDPGEIVVLGGAQLGARLSGQIEVRLDNGAPATVTAARERRNGLSVAVLKPLPDDFVERLAEARQLAIGDGREDILTVALGHARQGVEELNRCNEDLLQSWGIDVAARRALTRLPEPRNFRWAERIMPSEDAAIVIAIDVTDQGRPLDCRVLVSSGHPRMDRALCNVARSQARFEPGLDAAARPVAAQYVTRVRWVIRD